ncbi:camphor resistance protein CrcB [Halomonas urumqiensis]|uniref:Fluoride-specific ion channel FluC n=2 Tax=Halomonas urumqiensis TaxID=1684789 RepID=A0A2N7UNX9_9GAMM|nr:camphor resistance protein CrcB [Halomonas urumqiensis]PTB02519.1 CrcB family protein [Halomonas urumqiensis]
MLGILLVAVGGALGGMGRLAVGHRVSRHLGSRFPWGTLFVNLSGTLLVGWLAGSLLAGQPLTGERLAGPGWELLGIGLLGGYTTVSTFSLQTLSLWQQGRSLAALANIAATLMGGGMALLVGWWLAEVVT